MGLHMKLWTRNWNTCLRGRWMKSVRVYSLHTLLFPEVLITEDTDATNELINDGEFVQPLTVDDIQALKQSGVHASVCKDLLSMLYISL